MVPIDTEDVTLEKDPRFAHLNLSQVCDDFLARKKNLSFNELVRLAENVGFVFKKQDGTSHRHGKHCEYVAGPPAYDKMTFQSHKGKAVPYQVQQLVTFIRTAQKKEIKK